MEDVYSAINFNNIEEEFYKDTPLDLTYGSEFIIHCSNIYSDLDDSISVNNNVLLPTENETFIKLTEEPLRSSLEENEGQVISSLDKTDMVSDEVQDKLNQNDYHTLDYLSLDLTGDLFPEDDIEEIKIEPGTSKIDERTNETEKGTFNTSVIETSIKKPFSDSIKSLSQNKKRRCGNSDLLKSILEKNEEIDIYCKANKVSNEVQDELNQNDNYTTDYLSLDLTDDLFPEDDIEEIKIEPGTSKIDERTNDIDKRPSKTEKIINEIDERTSEIEKRPSKIEEITNEIDERTSEIEKRPSKIEEITNETEKGTFNTSVIETGIKRPFSDSTKILNHIKKRRCNNSDSSPLQTVPDSTAKRYQGPFFYPHDHRNDTDPMWNKYKLRKVSPFEVVQNDWKNVALSYPHFDLSHMEGKRLQNNSNKKECVHVGRIYDPEISRLLQAKDDILREMSRPTQKFYQKNKLRRKRLSKINEDLAVYKNAKEELQYLLSNYHNKEFDAVFMGQPELEEIYFEKQKISTYESFYGRSE